MSRALSDAPLVATHSNAHALCPHSRNLTDRQLAAIRESGGMVGVNFATSFLRPDGRRDPDTPLERDGRHIDYLIEQVGEDGVGFGSDFDGATMPRAIGDAAGLPALVDAMRRHGYDEALLASSVTRTGCACWRGPGASRAPSAAPTSLPDHARVLEGPAIDDRSLHLGDAERPQGLHHARGDRRCPTACIRSTSARASSSRPSSWRSARTTRSRRSSITTGRRRAVRAVRVGRDPDLSRARRPAGSCRGRRARASRRCSG